MVNYVIKKVNDPNLVKEFVLQSGSAVKTFRYFNSRNFDVICNHLITYLLYDDLGFPIGYGHLEFEGDKLWLGIAISEKFQSFGFGKIMLTHLIEFAKEKEMEFIYLSVDIQNIFAINLYQKFGFQSIGKMNDSVQLMSLDLSL
jgi:GNAT superfamily N-acetyltransferase